MRSLHSKLTPEFSLIVLQNPEMRWRRVTSYVSYHNITCLPFFSCSATLSHILTLPVTTVCLLFCVDFFNLFVIVVYVFNVFYMFEMNVGANFVALCALPSKSDTTNRPHQYLLKKRYVKSIRNEVRRWRWSEKLRAALFCRALFDEAEGNILMRLHLSIYKYINQKVGNTRQDILVIGICA